VGGVRGSVANITFARSHHFRQPSDRVRAVRFARTGLVSPVALRAFGSLYAAIFTPRFFHQYAYSSPLSVGYRVCRHSRIPGRYHSAYDRKGGAARGSMALARHPSASPKPSAQVVLAFGPDAPARHRHPPGLGLAFPPLPTVGATPFPLASIRFFYPLTGCFPPPLAESEPRGQQLPSGTGAFPCAYPPYRTSHKSTGSLRPGKGQSLALLQRPIFLLRHAPK
jgi:hypothetical protein